MRPDPRSSVEPSPVAGPVGNKEGMIATASPATRAIPKIFFPFIVLSEVRPLPLDTNTSDYGSRQWGVTLLNDLPFSDPQGAPNQAPAHLELDRSSAILHT
jgi:hypothetical protein